MPPTNNLNNESPSEPKTKSFSWKGLLREILIFALIAFGIVLPFRVFIAEPYIVEGASMEPTFDTGDYLIVDKISHRFKELVRNSVVIFKIVLPNSTSSRNLIKRVIGLPGDTVIINGNTVTIKNKDNPEGFELNQVYVKFALPSNEIVTLKENEYFVMGDNRAESYDSRSWGILPGKDILGTPILELFPINKISILPGNYK